MAAPHTSVLAPSNQGRNDTMMYTLRITKKRHVARTARLQTFKCLLCGLLLLLAVLSAVGMNIKKFDTWANRSMSQDDLVSVLCLSAHLQLKQNSI